MRFTDFKTPPKTVMIYARTPEEAETQVRSVYAEGADAFGFGGEFLEKRYRNEKDLKKIFSLFGNKPFFVTSYRTHESAGLDDDACVEYLFLMQSCGSTACDVMGDLYAPSPDEMTFDGTAVEKQKLLIKTLHARGSDVIMSCHQTVFKDEATCLRFASAETERGADIVKIVNVSKTEADAIANDAIVTSLAKTVKKPFLYLTRGETSMPLRLHGPERGVCMYLCRATETGFQPTVAEVLAAKKD